jgi:hypothetical protein
MLFFGVDGEMSAADVHAGGRLIQIGFAAHSDRTGGESEIPTALSMLINPGAMRWDDRAAAIHGFSRAEVRSAAEPNEADETCHDWLCQQGVTRARSAIAVGFNVGAFDLPHIAAVLPRTAALLSRRSVDLNAVCFTLEGVSFQGGRPSWSGWKRMASTYAERRITSLYEDTGVAHDAGYDALLHLFAWRFLRAAAHGAPLAIPQEKVRSISKDTQQAVGALLAALGIQESTVRTGFTPDQLRGWANGGRVVDPEILARIRASLPTDITPSG